MLIAFYIWVLLLNLAGFILMGNDKKRARRGAWRIPEKTFFLVSLLGGSLGCWLGMYCFRHKTRHWYFRVFIPVIFFAETALLGFLFWKYL